jgi:hypothetical protein
MPTERERKQQYIADDYCLQLARQVYELAILYHTDQATVMDALIGLLTSARERMRAEAAKQN